MAKYEFFGYSPDALRYESASNGFRLDPGYHHQDDRLLFVVAENRHDIRLDGNRRHDEIADDNSQRGSVFDTDGNCFDKGNFHVEGAIRLRAPDGSVISVERIQINGELMGYVPSRPLEPGVSYSLLGATNVPGPADNRDGGDDDEEEQCSGDGGTRKNYACYEANSVASFGPGTLITTEDGEIPVEWLDTSHKVLTRDSGFQPILWVGRTRFSPAYFEKHPDRRPLRVPAGTLGMGLPENDLHVAGNHRLLIRTCAADRMFGATEVLAPAKAWADLGRAEAYTPRQPYVLTHVLCAQHEVVRAQGAWVETLSPDAETLADLPEAHRIKVRAMLGARLHDMRFARPCLRRRDAYAVIEQSRDSFARPALDTVRIRA